MRRTNRLFQAPVVLTAAFLIGFVCDVSADEFPETYIRQQLVEAKRGIPVDVSQLAGGQLFSVKYLGRPVFIYRRTPSDIRQIENEDASGLADPQGNNIRASIRREYGSSSSAVWARLLLLTQAIAAKYPYRSIDKTLTVVAGWSPESGCVIRFIEPNARTTPGVVFRDPCTGAQFDAAGRAFAVELSTPSGKRQASSNLSIPPYWLETNQKLVIGPQVVDSIPELPFSRDELYIDKDPTKLLIAAARYNDIDTAQAALKAGAKADYFKAGEGSPIDAAVIGSSMTVIELLVAHGARQTPNTANGALFVGRQEVLTYLKSVPR